MKSSDGAILEVSEWKLKSAKIKAHKTPEVMSLGSLMMELGKDV
jgi:hypothetical protein